MHLIINFRLIKLTINLVRSFCVGGKRNEKRGEEKRAVSEINSRKWTKDEENSFVWEDVRFLDLYPIYPFWGTRET